MYKNALVAQAAARGRPASRSTCRWSDWATLVQRRNKPELCDVVLHRHHVQSRAGASTRASRATGRAGGARRTRSGGWMRSRARASRASARRCWEKVQAHLLRGRRAHQVRRLLLARGRPQGRPGLPAQRAAALERLADVWLKLRVKTYVARRLLALIPVALVVATVAFVLIHLAPGDPASVIAGPDANADDVAAHRAPARARCAASTCSSLRWYGRLLQGDLGRVDLPAQAGDGGHRRPGGAHAAAHALRHRRSAIAIGVPAGVLSARYHNSATDQALMVFALRGRVHPELPARIAADHVLLGVARLVSGGGLFAARVRLARARCARSCCPPFALGLVQSALIARIARSRMLDVLREQYITAGPRQGAGRAGRRLQARAAGTR